MSLLVALVIAGCGSSGEWSDDPENVERAWGLTLPSGVTLEHSLYCRSPHFTLEESYHFQFSPSPELRQAFIDANVFVLQDASLFDRTGTCRETPAWFLPKPLLSYEAWSKPDDFTNPEAWVFVDRETGTWFVYSCQL